MAEIKRCAGDAPVWWTSTSECFRLPDVACGSGDSEVMLSNLAVPRCGPRGDRVRWFNHAAAMKCLNHLAAQNRPAGHRNAAPGLAQGAFKSEEAPASGYRILMVGISNMLHIWHMMQPDDVPRW